MRYPTPTKQTGFFPAYKIVSGRRRTTYAQIARKYWGDQKPPEIGVYIIRNPRGEIAYVGRSSFQLYSTIYRHFQRQTDSQKRTEYLYNKEKYRIKILWYRRNDDAAAAEEFLRNALRPVDEPAKRDLQPGYLPTRKNQRIAVDEIKNDTATEEVPF